MRIENFSQIQQIYNAQKTPVKSNVTGTSDFKDRLNISSTGKDLQVAKQAVKDAPDIREDKVNALKNAISNGTYDVTSEDFADKIMDKLSQVLV